MADTDWTPEQRLLVEALASLCREEADQLDEACDAFDRLGDMPAFLRRRMGAHGSLPLAQQRVVEARRALEARRDAVARWLHREVGEA